MELEAYRNLKDTKRIERSIGPVSESVDVIEVLKPIYNFKAS